MTVGERIAKTRIEKKIPQKDLANKLGVSPSMIAQYESGRRTPSEETLIRISALLDVPYHSLIDVEQISPELLLKTKEDELANLRGKNMLVYQTILKLENDLSAAQKHSSNRESNTSDTIKSLEQELQKYTVENELLGRKIESTYLSVHNLRLLIAKSLSNDTGELEKKIIQEELNAYKEEYVKTIYNVTKPINNTITSENNSGFVRSLTSLNRVASMHRPSPLNAEGQKVAMGYIAQLKEQIKLLAKIPGFQASPETSEIDTPNPAITEEYSTTDELLFQIFNEIVFHDDSSDNQE